MVHDSSNLTITIFTDIIDYHTYEYVEQKHLDIYTNQKPNLNLASCHEISC